jgi:inner membrane protein
MDNVCHTLVGAACGEAGLKQLTRFGAATLMITANLPDVDVLVFATEVPSVAFRRGWTHGVVAQAALPLVFTALMMTLDRLRPPRQGPRARWQGLLLLSYVGVLSHVFLDYLNNYGIRLLMPFSNRWFYGDAVFIADPWLWGTLGAGIWLARRARRPAAARIALGISAVYIVVMLMSARAARTHVLAAWRADHGAEPRALMVGPVFFNPFRKVVIVDRGDVYEQGVFYWLPPRLEMQQVVATRADSPEAGAARADPNVQALLLWARFPYYEIENAAWGRRVIVSDMRFGRFVAATTVMVK